MNRLFPSERFIPFFSCKSLSDQIDRKNIAFDENNDPSEKKALNGYCGCKF